MIETRKANVNSQLAWVQTESSIASWRVVQEIREAPPIEGSDDRKAQSIPSRAELLVLVDSGKCSPPAEWWDEHEDPFLSDE